MTQPQQPSLCAVAFVSQAEDLDDAPVPHITHDPDTGLPWPEPTVPEPDFVTLAGFLFEEASDTTDGCLTTIDGVCRHGHPSWLLRLGVV